jgi:hypothetical protein
MESHIAAAAAQAHGLPFAASRVIIDHAQLALPPAALVHLRPDGTPDVAAVLRSVFRQPRAAQLALRAGRKRLGAGLSFPGFRAPAQGDLAAAYEPAMAYCRSSWSWSRPPAVKRKPQPVPGMRLGSQFTGPYVEKA